MLIFDSIVYYTRERVTYWQSSTPGNPRESSSQRATYVVPEAIQYLHIHAHVDFGICRANNKQDHRMVFQGLNRPRNWLLASERRLEPNWCILFHLDEKTEQHRTLRNSNTESKRYLSWNTLTSKSQLRRQLMEEGALVWTLGLFGRPVVGPQTGHRLSVRTQGLLELIGHIDRIAHFAYLQRDGTGNMKPLSGWRALVPPSKNSVCDQLYEAQISYYDIPVQLC
jgi:hypothetical protein